MLAFIVVMCVVVAFLAYGWLEAGWLRRRVVDVAVPGLPRALDGFRIAHLSDLHLGVPLSRGNGAGVRAVAWIVERRPDLVCITGDLVSRPRGTTRLKRLLALLDAPLVVLGNHDVAVTRDPFSRTARLGDLGRATVLRDETIGVIVRGERVSVAGVDPGTYRMKRTQFDALVDTEAAFRLLLCHFPEIVRRAPRHAFELVLTGHVHGGQICVPLRRRRVGLAHPGAPYVSGVYRTEAGVMHVSPGTGTTFVPLRFFARPEVTELVLRVG